MPSLTDEEISFIKANHGKKSLTTIASELNRSYSAVKTNARKLGLSGEPGKSSFSRKQPKYEFNEQFFTEINLLNSYWGGLISADGNIKSINNQNQSLTILLSKKDVGLLERFRYDLRCNKPIYEFLSHGFETCSLTINSTNIVSDLYSNFNITPRKSLTNIPPHIVNDEYVDSFIIGYIDGDGWISRTNTKNKTVLGVAGTLEMLEWIRLRCRTILGYDVGSIHKKNNIYTLIFTNKAANILIGHFNDVPIEKLKRKWIGVI